MSDVNRYGLRITPDSSDTVPVTLAPNELTALRITGAPDLAYAPQTIVSNEIRSDRQRSDLIPVGAEAGGSIDFELSHGTFDDLIASVMFSSWTNAPRDEGTGGITATGAGTIDVDDGTIYKVDHIVRIMNTTGTDVGDGVYVIDGIATDVLTVSPFDGNTNAMAAGVTIGATSILVVVGVQSSAVGEYDITKAASVVTITATGASDFDDLMGSGVELAAGQWIKTSGFDNAGNNVWARILARTTTTITYAEPTGAVDADSPTGLAQIWFGDYIVNGAEAIASHQYLIEQRYEDHNPVTREVLLAMALASMSLNLEPQSIATGNFTFFGQNSEVSDNSGGSYSELYDSLPADIAASTSDVYNTSSNVGRIGRGASTVASSNKNFVTSASIEIDNGLRRRGAVGVFGAASIGIGEFAVSGNLSAYFDDKTLLVDILQGNDTSYDTTVVSNDKRSLTFDLPRINFASGAPTKPGKNQDVIIPLTYEALLDSTLGYTMSVQRGFYSI